MHGHSNGREPIELPPTGGSAYEIQKLVLLELVIDAPPAGDAVERICELLDARKPDVEAALDALRLVGLAGQRHNRAFATAAARSFEHLWPIGL